MAPSERLRFRLPQELVDHTIDYLHNDSIALKSCSLVCRSWLPTSRLHLFSSIAFKARPPKSPLGQPRNLCNRFYNLLVRNPELARHVHALEIWEGAPFAHLTRADMRYTSWITEEPALPLTLTKLTSLKRLQFCGNSVISYQHLPKSLQHALYSVLALPSLTYIRLHNWAFPTFSDLALLLARTTNLKGLALSSTCVSELEDDLDGLEDPQTSSESVTTLATLDATTSHNATQSPGLEFLTLDFVEFKNFGYWLLSQRCPLNARTLRELRVAHSQSVATTSRLLTSIGGSLEHLHLKPGPWDVHTFDLGLNPCLRSLRLTLEDPSQAIPWVLTLFSTVTDYNSLERVGLEFYADLKRMEGWSEVDAVLTRAELAGLRRVDVGVFAHPSHAEFGKVKKELKGLEGRGVLRVYQLGIKSQKSSGELTPTINRFQG